MGVCGALEFVQLNLLIMPPKPALPEMDGRLFRNCLNVGGGGKGDIVRSWVASLYMSVESSSLIERVLWVETLRRESWPRTAEDGVMLGPLRLELLRRGGGGDSRRNVDPEASTEDFLAACRLKLSKVSLLDT